MAVIYLEWKNQEVCVLSPLIHRLSWTVLIAALACVSFGCATHETDAQRQSDREMSERVQAALNADTGLFAKHINVRADNGVVRLTGYVWEATDFQEATYIASNVPGVTKVVNDLELNRNGNDNGPIAR